MLAGRNFNVNQLLNWRDEGSRFTIYLNATINYSIMQIPSILSNTFINNGGFETYSLLFFLKITDCS